MKAVVAPLVERLDREKVEGWDEVRKRGGVDVPIAMIFLLDEGNDSSPRASSRFPSNNDDAKGIEFMSLVSVYWPLHRSSRSQRALPSRL